MSLNCLKALTNEERDKVFSKTRYVSGWLRLMGEQVEVVTVCGGKFHHLCLEHSLHSIKYSVLRRE